MRNPPKNHEWVETEDGSFTLYSQTFDENCHSLSGAQGETEKYFIQDSGLELAIQTKDELCIFETGFGLGLNFMAVYQLTKTHDCRVHYVSTEIDEGLVDWFFEDNRKYQSPNFTYEVLKGDARNSLPIWVSKNPDRKFQFIFQDAFSPKKNPTLWEQSWFELLGSVCNQATLITYSASHSVQKNLMAAGWKIEQIPGYGKKRAATRATR